MLFSTMAAMDIKLPPLLALEHLNIDQNTPGVDTKLLLDVECEMLALWATERHLLVGWVNCAPLYCMC